VKSVTSSEALEISGGRLNLGASAADVSTFSAPLTLTGGTLGGSGTLNVSTLNLNGGTLTGGLQVTANVSNVGGTITAGSSPGSLVINGNYVQGSNGTLVVEIAGMSGSQYDRLIVNGSTVLGGTLRVVPLNGFIPADGATFDNVVQSSGPLSGTFASTIFPASPTFKVVYLPASVSIAVSGFALPPGAVGQASQVVVALTDQNQNTLISSQLTGGLPVEVLELQQEKEKSGKTPMCNASSSGGGGDGGGGGGGGMVGGGYRCTSRGCI
jgi:hypothetical protein